MPDADQIMPDADRIMRDGDAAMRDGDRAMRDGDGIMPEAEQPPGPAERTIFAEIRSLLDRRGAVGVEITLDSNLSGGALDLDSLELAELSAALEDALGRDPYSEGCVPETVRELVGFYRA